MCIKPKYSSTLKTQQYPRKYVYSSGETCIVSCDNKITKYQQQPSSNPPPIFNAFTRTPATFGTSKHCPSRRMPPTSLDPLHASLEPMMTPNCLSVCRNHRRQVSTWRRHPRLALVPLSWGPNRSPARPPSSTDSLPASPLQSKYTRSVGGGA